jgi:hypothetical protein
MTSTLRTLAIACLSLACLTLARAQDPALIDESKEKLVAKEPPFALTRPSKEWVFIDLEKAKEKLAREKTIGAAEEAFKTIKARLYHGGHPADFFVYAWEDSRDELSSSSVGNEQLEQTKARLKDAKVTGSGATTLGKHKAFAFEAEGSFDGKPLAVSKLIVYRATDKQVFVVSLECPKDKAKLARKDLAKLLKGLQL